MKDSKKDLWDDVARKVALLTDRLGMPVDDGIAETVTALNLLGFKTTMSCSGHADRFTGGPYVMTVSDEADEYRKQCALIGKPSDATYKELYAKSVQVTLSTHLPLFSLLDRFYATRIVAYEQRLVLRLMFSGFRVECQGASLARVIDEQAQQSLLSENQSEMVAFTQFLKNVFFEQE